MADETVLIGGTIKELRIDKGMSIEDVAEKSGISEDTLTKIESNEILPPLGEIIRLANTFEVSVGDIFGDSADSPFCIVRSDNRRSVSRFNSTDDKAGRYSYEGLGHQKKDRQMEPFLVTLRPTEVHDMVPNQHVGEEFIFVLEGQVDVRLFGYKDTLNPGDSIYYDSDMPHVVSCHGDKPATILAVIYVKDEMIIF